MAEPDRLQLGQSVAAVGAAEEDWSLVADQLATAVSEDGRAVGEARPILLAPVGRGPSDAQGVQRDSAADLGAAIAGGVRAGGLTGRKGSEEKKEGWWSCPRIAPKRAQVTGPLRSGRGPPRFVWALVRFPAVRCAKVGRNRGDCCLLFKAGRPKRKSRLRFPRRDPELFISMTNGLTGTWLGQDARCHPEFGSYWFAKPVAALHCREHQEPSSAAASSAAGAAVSDGTAAVAEDRIVEHHTVAAERIVAGDRMAAVDRIAAVERTAVAAKCQT